MPGPLECLKVSPECPVSNTIYGYYPNLAANIFFTVFFGLFTIANLTLGVRHKTWSFTVAMTLGCFAEALGYVGRTLLHYNPYDDNGFEIQICCLILAPAFNSAAIYLVFKHVTLSFGREWSRIRPKFYTWCFITADILALILQGAGGGIAATADTSDMLKLGENLMMSGICWQVATLLVFGALVTDYILRRHLSATPLSPSASAQLGSRTFQLFALGLLVAFLAIFTRCVYRIAEMSGGWQNPIMQNEGLFIGLDGCMVALATLCQTVFHPGYCFPQMSSSSAASSSSKKNGGVEREEEEEMGMEVEKEKEGEVGSGEDEERRV